MADGLYEIRLTRSAERDLRNLPRAAQVKIARAIDQLAVSPCPRGAKLLAGVGTLRIFRIRVGDYRILYELRDDQLAVVVIAVGHRREVYRSRR